MFQNLPFQEGHRQKQEPSQSPSLSNSIHQCDHHLLLEIISSTGFHGIIFPYVLLLHQLFLSFFCYLPLPPQPINPDSLGVSPRLSIFLILYSPLSWSYALVFKCVSPALTSPLCPILSLKVLQASPTYHVLTELTISPPTCSSYKALIDGQQL